jgi:hypothetical protein
MVSVTLLAYPSEDPLCKLLSPRYQNSGDNYSRLWAVEHEKQVYVSATGHAQHIILQSGRADIYQLFTQPGEYLSLRLQPKPSWLYILIKIETEDEEIGGHRHVEELTSVQLLLFKLLLQGPYLELPIGTCLYVLQLARRRMEGMEPCTVLVIMHRFQLTCHAVIFCMSCLYEPIPFKPSQCK